MAQDQRLPLSRVSGAGFAPEQAPAWDGRSFKPRSFAAAGHTHGSGVFVQSTVSAGLPTLTDRNVGDLHFNKTDLREYVVESAALGSPAQQTASNSAGSTGPGFLSSFRVGGASLFITSVGVSSREEAFPTAGQVKVLEILNASRTTVLASTAAFSSALANAGSTGVAVELMFPLATGVSLSANTEYWIGVRFVSAAAQMQVRNAITAAFSGGIQQVTAAPYRRLRMVTAGTEWTAPVGTAIVDAGEQQMCFAMTGTVLQWTSTDEHVATHSHTATSNTLVDAKGDLIVGTADNTVARLPVGFDSYVLTADATQPTGLKWTAPTGGSGGGSLSVQDENGTPITGVTQIDFQGAGVTAVAGTGEVVVTIPGGSGTGFSGCRARRTTAQSIANNTNTILTFDAERYDTDGYHDNSVNPSRFTIPPGLGGVFRIGAQVEFAASVTGNRVLQLKVNGTTLPAVEVRLPPTGGFLGAMTISTDYALSAGDYVEVEVYHNAGVALNINVAGNSSPEFYISRLG